MFPALPCRSMQRCELTYRDEQKKKSLTWKHRRLLIGRSASSGFTFACLCSAGEGQQLNSAGAGTESFDIWKETTKEENAARPPAPVHLSTVQNRAADLRLSPTASPSQAPTGHQNAAPRSGDGTGLAQLLPLQIVSLLTSFLSDSPQLLNWHGCNSKLQWQVLACSKQGQHAKPKAESLKREFEARAQNWLWKPSHPETFFDMWRKVKIKVTRTRKTAKPKHSWLPFEKNG